MITKAIKLSKFILLKQKQHRMYKVNNIFMEVFNLF